MKSKNIIKICLLLILFVLFFIIYIKFYNEKEEKNTQIKKYETACGMYKEGEIKINLKNILVYLADDECKRSLGLSNKTSLNENEGIFFVFEKIGNYNFWMKDMNFPLDIFWINDNFEIIGIEKNISTSTYPKSFGNQYLAKYILETQALYSEKNNIKIGDKIDFFQN